MSETHEHLEHAEHAEHNSHDPFNQRVAVSMAIVAALLAGISMMGHRTHNRVLQLQGDSNRYRTEAATAEVEKSNLYAWYQAKKVRQTQLETAATILRSLPVTRAVSDDPLVQTAADWQKKADEYNHHGTEDDNLPDLQRRGDEAGLRAKDATKRADDILVDAERTHRQAERLDIGHLSSELGLVLCSIALLTKKKGYWFAGLGAAILALGLTASAYLIAPEPREASHSAAPAEQGNPH
jgi:hypothetical protein